MTAEEAQQVRDLHFQKEVLQARQEQRQGGEGVGRQPAHLFPLGFLIPLRQFSYCCLRRPLPPVPPRYRLGWGRLRLGPQQGGRSVARPLGFFPSTRPPRSSALLPRTCGVSPRLLLPLRAVANRPAGEASAVASVATGSEACAASASARRRAASSGPPRATASVMRWLRSSLASVVWSSVSRLSRTAWSGSTTVGSSCGLGCVMIRTPWPACW